MRSLLALLCRAELPLMAPLSELSPAAIHTALEPAWRAWVEERNAAGLVRAKEEGRRSEPLSASEAFFQFQRVQRGEVDSARLLLVFGLVPASRFLDGATAQLFEAERAGEPTERSGAEGQLQALPYGDGSTPLHLAATFGLTESLKTLLRSGADVNARSDSGLAAVHAAAIAGHASALEILLGHGADQDARHAFAGNSPLHFAAEMGHVSVVRRLCALGADVEAEKFQDGTALHTAADTNNAAVARVLLEECGADAEALLLGDTAPLYLAAGRGFAEVVDALVAAGANVDRTLRQRWPRSAVGPHFEEANGATALHNACENGRLGAVEALLAGGARQLATMEGVTPLITALQYAQPEIAMLLLDGRSEANVDVRSPRDGQSALHIAAAMGYAPVVARILHLRGTAELRDHRHRRPLDYAKGQVRWLLQRFSGRDAALDRIASKHVEGQESFEELEASSKEAKEVYQRALRSYDKGTLLEELSATLKSASKSASSERDVSELNVKRFVLAGASDLPIAIEAMRQDSEESMRVALILLGLQPKNVSYGPGKALLVDGRDVTAAVALLRTAPEDAEALAQELRAGGVHGSEEL